MFINVNAVAAMVAQEMVSRVDASPKNYLEDSDFESVYESCFDKVTAPMNLKGDAYTQAYERVGNHPEVLLAFDAIKEIQREARIEAQDAIRLAENPGKYYGVSNSDFI